MKSRHTPEPADTSPSAGDGSKPPTKHAGRRKRGHPTLDHKKPASRAKVERVVATVGKGLEMPFPVFFTQDRGTNQESLARVLAMGLSARLGVPFPHIALVFGRKWATVYVAVRSCRSRYRNSPAFREIWDTLLGELAPGKRGVGRK